MTAVEFRIGSDWFRLDTLGKCCFWSCRISIQFFIRFWWKCFILPKRKWWWRWATTARFSSNVSEPLLRAWLILHSLCKVDRASGRVCMWKSYLSSVLIMSWLNLFWFPNNLWVIFQLLNNHTLSNEIVNEIKNSLISCPVCERYWLMWFHKSMLLSHSKL